MEFDVIAVPWEIVPPDVFFASVTNVGTFVPLLLAYWTPTATRFTTSPEFNPDASTLKKSSWLRVVDEL